MPGVRPRYTPNARRPVVTSPEFLQFIEGRKQSAAEEYRGVVPSGGIVPGLFPLQSTGISTAPVVAAARAYLDGLSEVERQEAVHPMDADSWRHWSNHARFYLRHGICLEDLSTDSRERALELIRASLSGKGYFLVRDAMHINYTLGVITGQEFDFDEWLYWITIYGDPSSTGAWGWQLDGHHVNLNCAFVGDQMVLTPMFIGAEPVRIDTGPYAGVWVFRTEEADGLALAQTFDPAQRSKAIIGDELPAEVFTGAFRDNFDLDYQGISFKSLNEDQQHRIMNLLALYVTRMRPSHSQQWMSEIAERADEIHFAWIGGTEDDSVFYYRLHSPLILVEFDHQPGQNFDNDYPTRSHVHTIIRTPNGNDYGKDLLRQHHERYPHGRS